MDTAAAASIQIGNCFFSYCSFGLTQKNQKVKANADAPQALPGQRPFSIETLSYYTSIGNA
jgi:hypothetical protein